MCSALSDERSGLSFTIATGPRQRGNDDHILLSDLRLPQPGGPGGLVLPLGTGFPFRRHLLLVQLRRSY
jgi:hypothetical protein